MINYPKNPDEIARLLNEEELPDPSKMTPGGIYRHAFTVIKGRWPEAEPYIMKDPYWALSYAVKFIGGRWPEAEPYIMQDPIYAYEYAAHVIKDRWPEYEEYMINKNPNPNPLDDYQDGTDEEYWDYYREDFMNV